MVRICIWMLRIPFEWLEFAFEFRMLHLNLNASNGSNLHLNFSLSNGSNLHLNASKPFRMVRISNASNNSNASNLHSNALNPFRMLQIWIWMLQIPFEWFEFAFECFEYLSNSYQLHWNASNPFRMVRIINAKNPFRMVRIWIRMIPIPFSNASNFFRIWIPFEWLEFPFKCFQ